MVGEANPRAMLGEPSTIVEKGQGVQRYTEEANLEPKAIRSHLKDEQGVARKKDGCGSKQTGKIWQGGEFLIFGDIQNRS